MYIENMYLMKLYKKKNKIFKFYLTKLLYTLLNLGKLLVADDDYSRWDMTK